MLIFLSWKYFFQFLIDPLHFVHHLFVYSFLLPLHPQFFFSFSIKYYSPVNSSIFLLGCDPRNILCMNSRTIKTYFSFTVFIIKIQENLQKISLVSSSWCSIMRIIVSIYCYIYWNTFKSLLINKLLKVSSFFCC